MEKYYRDSIIQFDEYTICEDENIFDAILDERKEEIDGKRFFLEYIPKEVLENYNFEDLESLKKFRNDCLGIRSPKMKMGGCNLDPDYLDEDRKTGYLRYAGIKLSDPYGSIYGSFDMRDGILTYSPLFPHFYEERDLGKFARDTYFTTMTFEAIMQVLIDKANECFIHTGNCCELGVKSPYILEKVTKDEMLKCVYDAKEGEKIYERVWK